MRIAIVEDNIEYAKSLEKYIEQYGKEFNLSLTVSYFPNGEQFIDAYKSNFEIIFMDIEMPIMDGIEASTKVRDVDSQCVIIFISNYMKYAIKGYSVNALDYLTKPLTYSTFKNTMDKAVLSIKKKVQKTIIVNDVANTYRININDIVYIEVFKHRVFYHTTQGDFDTRSTLTECEKELPSNQFVRCNSGYIVNLQYVTGISYDDLKIYNTTLPISRNRKKALLDSLTRFIGE